MTFAQHFVPAALPMSTSKTEIKFPKHNKSQADCPTPAARPPDPHASVPPFRTARKTFMGLSAFWAATAEKRRNSPAGLDKHSGFPYSEIQLRPY
jgi:hypothetical protein